MTNDERRRALDKAASKYNWSLRSTERYGDCQVYIYNQGNRHLGTVTMNEGGGYHREPKIRDQFLRDLFYQVVDGALAT